MENQLLGSFDGRRVTVARLNLALVLLRTAKRGKGPEIL